MSLTLVSRAADQGDIKVTLSVTEAPLSKVFKLIERQSGLVFLYNTNTVQVNDKVSLTVKDKLLDDVLAGLLKPRGLEWIYKDNKIVLRPYHKEIQQTFTVLNRDSTYASILAGTVTDRLGNPLPGASILVSGSNKGCAADNLGRFKILNAPKSAVLKVSLIGYEAIEIPAQGNQNLSIKLNQAVGLLDEKVVMAYGITSRRTATGSISKVSSDEIERQVVINPLEALQGRVPGLLVSQTNGIPGSSMKLQIRGQNSLIYGSDPLIIIDGVPLAANNGSINVTASIASPTGISPLNSLNPQDIESIEILKDADATAIYGSRGANGVILITTKRGKTGKSAFSANIYTGIKVVPHLVPMLSTSQYLKMRRDAFENDGIVPNGNPGTPGYAPDLKIWDTTRYTNWEKFLIGGTAHLTDATGSFSGGNDNTKFLLGTGYHYETTVFPSDMGYNRKTLSFSLNHKSNNQRLGIDFYTNYSSDNNHLFNSSLNSILLPPNTPSVYDSIGNLSWQEKGASFKNPLADFYKKYDIETENLLFNLSIAYKITNGLSVKSNFGYNSMNVADNSIIPQVSLDPNASGYVGAANYGSNKFKGYIVEPQVEYNDFILGGKFSALLGGSYQYNENSQNSITATGYTNDILINSLSDAPTISYKSNSLSDYKYAALFGRITYDYSDRYIVNFSARRDGSSRFGPDRRYNNFSAVGASWLIANEKWFDNFRPTLSFAKLRASYGVTGNDQIGDYKYLDAWGGAPLGPIYQGSAALVPNSLFNPDYSWERNKKLEGAVDVGFLNNRLLLSANYFRNRSGNQLVNYSLPSQTGFFSITRNLNAIIQNSGFEFTINADIINSEFFSWNLGINITVPKNSLVAFPGLSSSSYASKYVIGKSVNLIYGYKSIGIDPQTGVYQFADVNKDGQYSISDYKVSGSLDPKYYGGLTSNLQYKGVAIDFLLDFRNQLARDYLSNDISVSAIPGMMYNQPTFINEGYQKLTTNSSSPAFRAITLAGHSDLMYSDASYIKLRTLSLSYEVSRKILSRLKLQKLRFFLQGQNLFTITSYKGLDPETANFFFLPPLRSVTGGIQVSL